MATLNQQARNLTRIKVFKARRPKLAGSPQRRTVVLRLRICTPRKPNSARRPVIKGFMSSKKKVLSHIPGMGHSIKRYNKILVRGGGARDLPIVNYTCMRGVLDFEPQLRRRKRSKYGHKRPVELRVHIRRKYRNILD